MISCLDISNRAIGNALFNYYFLLTVAEKTGYKAFYPKSQEFMHHSGQRIQQLEEGFDIKIEKKKALFCLEKCSIFIENIKITCTMKVFLV